MGVCRETGHAFARLLIHLFRRESADHPYGAGRIVPQLSGAVRAMSKEEKGSRLYFRKVDEPVLVAEWHWPNVSQMPLFQGIGDILCIYCLAALYMLGPAFVRSLLERAIALGVKPTVPMKGLSPLPSDRLLMRPGWISGWRGVRSSSIYFFGANPRSAFRTASEATRNSSTFLNRAANACWLRLSGPPTP
jgi:hypothetical protein